MENGINKTFDLLPNEVALIFSGTGKDDGGGVEVAIAYYDEEREKVTTLRTSSVARGETSSCREVSIRK